MTKKISKQSETFKNLKNILKNGKNGYVATDDLSIIKVALDNNSQIEQVFYCDELQYQNDTQELLEYLLKTVDDSYIISKNNYLSLRKKENSVGIFAIIKLNLKSFDDIKANNYIVVADSLEIPGNLGTIYRTCDSAKVDAIILVDSITKITNPSLISSSRGCSLLVPTVVSSFEEANKWLHDNNYNVYLGEPNLGLDYKSYDYKNKIAIVVGNERFGINKFWYEYPHQKVFIPMFGSNNSLNVSVACSILVYEATMKRLK